MTPAQTGDRRADIKANLLERLHDPVQLRIVMLAVVLLIGYVAIDMPLGEQIAAKSRKLKSDERLLALAERLERLQEQYNSFADRIPAQTDGKEWVQYVLEGTRRFPLKLSKLECRDPKQLGPYKAVVLQIELEGSFFDLDKFLRWLESDRRLFRTDSVLIGPTRENKKILVMQVTVLGLTS